MYLAIQKLLHHDFIPKEPLITLNNKKITHLDVSKRKTNKKKTTIENKCKQNLGQSFSYLWDPFNTSTPVFVSVGDWIYGVLLPSIFYYFTN